MIGPHSSVAAHVYIGGGVSLGEGCVVGPSVEIKTCALFAATALLVGLCACGGRIDWLGEPAASTSPSDAGLSSSEGGVVEPPPKDSGAGRPASEDGCGLPLEAGVRCKMSPGTIHPLLTSADFLAIFTRRWLTCGGTTVGGQAGAAGFEAATGGIYTVLTYDASRNIVADGQGTYSIVGNPPNMWQTTFYGPPIANSSPGGADVIVVWEITDAPEMLVGNDNGVFSFRYVPANPWSEDAEASCP